MTDILEFNEEQKSFADMLEQVKNARDQLTTLKFAYEGNKLSADDLGYILKALTFVPKLQSLTLELKESGLGPVQTKDLFEQISQLTQLTELAADFENNEIQAQGANFIGQALKNLTNLENLSLTFGFSEINQEGTVNVCKGIQSLINLEELSLDFKFNQVQVEGMASIGSVLQKLNKLKNLTLSLEQCSIGADEIKPINAGLGSLDRLENLNLNLKLNNLGPEQAKELGYNLQKLKNVQEAIIDFAYNTIKTEGAQSISFAINQWKQLKKLQLTLIDNSLDQDGTKSLGNFAQLPNLEEFILEIGENNQGPESAKYLGEALGQMRNLQVLTVNLNMEKIQDQGCKFICQGISNLKQLNELLLKFCFSELTSESGKFIGESLRELTEISNLKLDLTENPKIGAAGAEEIRKGIEGLKNLKEFCIYLSCEKVEKSERNISDVLKKYSSLHIENAQLFLNNATISRKNSQFRSGVSSKKPSGPIKATHSNQSGSNNNYPTNIQAQLNEKNQKIQNLQEKIETKNDILIAVISIAVMVIILLAFLLICPRYRQIFQDDDYNTYGEGDIEGYMIDPKYFSSGTDSDADIFGNGGVEYNVGTWSD